MKDWVVNLTVVLSDGTILKTRKRPRKSSAGYNLNSLFVGPEGTLGFVTEATLKLTSIPEHIGVAVVTFPSMKAAAGMAIEVIRQGVAINAVEILDEVLMSVINRIGATSRRWEEVPTLFFKLSGSEAIVKDSISRVRSISQRHAAQSFQYKSDPHKQKALWSDQKEAFWSMMARLVHRCSGPIISGLHIDRYVCLGIAVSHQERGTNTVDPQTCPRRISLSWAYLVVFWGKLAMATSTKPFYSRIKIA
jgi:FAD/FMN-containing dehydrogenase